MSSQGSETGASNHIGVSLNAGTARAVARPRIIRRFSLVSCSALDDLCGECFGMDPLQFFSERSPI